jgi:hypothetical protein
MFESCGPLASDFAGGFPNETQNRSIRSAKPAQERELRLSFGRLYLQIISAFCRPRQHNGDLLRPVGARNRPRRWELDRGHRPLDAGLVGARARLVSPPKPKSGPGPRARQRARSSECNSATIIPGTTESFNPLTSQWEKSPLNTVGNTNGGSWHCVISRRSKQKEATYDFLIFLRSWQTRRTPFSMLPMGGQGCNQA